MENTNNNQIEFLTNKVKQVKLSAFNTAINAGLGHLGGSFSCAEILTVLYYSGLMKYDTLNTKLEDRDRLVLSKGHSNNVLHAILADVKFFNKEELNRYTKNEALLGGHCDNCVPGIEITSGSLGHGLGVACGMALNSKLYDIPYNVFCIIGDGETQEGSIWEALLFAVHHKLDNLIIFFDSNKLGCEDFIKNTCSLNFPQKVFYDIGYDTIEIDGHNVIELLDAIKKILDIKNGHPKILICNTIKGKGLSSLENTTKAHHTLPKTNEIDEIRQNLCK